MMITKNQLQVYHTKLKTLKNLGYKFYQITMKQNTQHKLMEVKILAQHGFYNSKQLVQFKFKSLHNYNLTTMKRMIKHNFTHKMFFAPIFDEADKMFSFA